MMAMETDSNLQSIPCLDITSLSQFLTVSVLSLRDTFANTTVFQKKNIAMRLCVHFAICSTQVNL